MAIQIDIADRLYDYTDEEKAVEAIEAFQAESGLDDQAVVAIWANENDPRRAGLEKLIFDAVDANGTARRAAENVPGVISIFME